MKPSQALLDAIRNAVAEGVPDKVAHLMASLDADAEGGPLILETLTAGLHEARQKLAGPSMTVAEFLMNIDAFNAGIKYGKHWMPSGQDNPHAVVGVVAGDVHTLGATIIAVVMEALGFEVTLLGQGTDAETFIRTIKESRATVLGLSSMMSTTLPAMKATVERVRREFPGVKILVGGAALDDALAETMNADGYAFSAVELPAEIERIRAANAQGGRSMRKYTDYENKQVVVETVESLPENHHHD